MHSDCHFSVERLVEFGLGIAVAKQMVAMWSDSMNSATAPPAEPMFYVSVEGKAVGPLNERQLFRLYHEDKITKDTLGWMPGMPSWLPVEQIPAMLKLFAVTSYYYRQCD